MRLNAIHGVCLQELASVFDLAWASAWGFQGHEKLKDILTVEEFPYVPMPPIPFPPSEKVPAVDAYAGERAVAWIDDVITPEATSWAKSRKVPTLLLPTDHRLGLERGHVDQLVEWAPSLRTSSRSTGSVAEG